MSASGNDQRNAEIAIVGMACLFPKAPDVATFWENVCGKIDAIGDPPASREMEPFLEAREETGLYCVRGGYIGDLACFHPAEFGVMPSALDGGEPDQFLALEVGHQTLLDAGIPDLPLNRERTEVILGRGTFVNRGTITQVQHNIALHQFIRLLRELHPEHDEAELAEIREKLKAHLPPINAETAGGSSPNLVSGRVANRFDLKGLNCTLDAACASSLVAIERGMNDLREGRCDAALVGGVQVSTPAPIHNMFAKMGALSRLPHLRPFDKDADGTMLGEGAGMILLKRREDAERDGHRVYALIRAVGISSDGRAKAVLTPRVEGEELALRRAYEAAGVSPSSVGLLEAHGTAMPVGDETEIQALRRVFGDRRGAPTCALGSVKSMISHLLPASGIAGTIKAALALYQKVLPPTLRCENPNPKLEIEKTPFYLNTETRPWIHAGPGPRRAGVNAFGFGGINAHAILDEFPAQNETMQPSLHRTWDTELVILQGSSREEILEKGRALAGFLERFPDTPLRHVAYTANAELGNPGLRLAIVASDAGDLGRKLAHSLKRLADPECRRIKDRGGIYFFDEKLKVPGRMAFLFPGEGSQYPNMLADLCFHFPVVRSRFDLMERAFKDHPRGYTPAQFIFPPPSPGATVAAEEQERLLWQMDGAVESVFVASSAIAALLRQLGLEPDVAAGHSAGEYTALLITGATQVDSEEALVRMILDVNSVYQRLYETQSVPTVALIAVGGADPGLLEELVQSNEGKLHIAMDNCHYQVVLCAEPDIAGGIIARLRSSGAICNTLPFDRPYHTPLFEPAYRYLLESFPPIDRPRTEIELWSCATASPYPESLEEARRVALEQWIRPVRFRQTIEAMYEAGVRTFVEVGPRGNMTSFVNDVLRKRPFVATPSNLPGRSGISQLHHMLGLLAANGMPLTLDPLYQRRLPERLDFRMEKTPAGQKQASVKISLALPYFRLGAEEALGRRQPSAVPRSAMTPPAMVTSAPPQARGDGFRPGGNGLPGAEAPAPHPAAADLGAQPAAREMQSYFETMQRFLEIQNEIMHAFLEEPSMAASRPAHPETEAPLAGVEGETAGKPSSIRGSGPPQAGPLVGEILSFAPQRSLQARRRLDPHEDLFLKDHTLGGRPSRTDASLIALPIMPFTMTLEMAAEAAALLAPGRLLVEMRDIRAHRWITFDEGPVAVEIAAERLSENGVRVVIGEAPGATAASDPSTDAGSSRAAHTIFEGTALFGEAYPPAPEPGGFDLEGDRPSTWTSERLYKAGMFHGESFQGVEGVDRWGENGVAARLLTLPSDRLFRSTAEPRFLVDPILLDAAGQLVAFWNSEHDVRGINSTPFKLESLTVHGPPLPVRTRLTARARIRKLAPDHLRADLDVIRPDGRTYIRMTGWEDRCFELPEPICPLTSSSEGLTLSEPWDGPIVPLRNREAYRCRRVHRWPQGTFEGFGMIWQKQVAHLILTRAEREVYRSIRKPPRARTEWLFARAAVKDAVCQLLRDRHGIDLLPADVEIASDPLGKPVVRGPAAELLERPPAIAMGHSRGIAVAIAADGELDLGVGIDAEFMRALGEGFERIAFSDEESRILEAVTESLRAEWRLRSWCAKEAVAKALGTGLTGKPRDLVLRKLDESSGVAAIEVSGEPARLRPSLSGTSLEVYTLREDDLVAAVTTCRRSET